MVERMWLPLSNPAPYEVVMSVPRPRVPKVKGKGGERRIGVRTYTLRPSKLEASNEALQIPPPQSHLFPCHVAEGDPERGFITKREERERRVFHFSMRIP